MTHLLDGNVLIALVLSDHVHHERVRNWFGRSRSFATCPITQSTLLRLLVREGAPAPQALTVLQQVTAHRSHQFWPDALGFGEVETARIVGHRQITDAYLAQLARSNSGRVATLDDGLCAAHPDVARAIP